MRFERQGYSHRIAMLIDETIVTFEPDEGGSYRSMGTVNIEPNCCKQSRRSLLR